MYREIKQAASNKVIDHNTPITYNYKANIEEAENLLQNQKENLFNFEIQELEHYLKLVKEAPSIENNNLLLADAVFASAKRLKIKEYSNKTINLLETLPSPLDIVLGKEQYSIHQFLSNCLVVLESQFVNHNFNIEKYNLFIKLIGDYINAVECGFDYSNLPQEYKNLRIKKNFGKDIWDKDFNEVSGRACEDIWRSIGWYELLFRLIAEKIREIIIIEHNGNFQKRAIQKDLEKFKNSYLEFQTVYKSDLAYIENYLIEKKADLLNYEEKYFYYDAYSSLM